MLKRIRQFFIKFMYPSNLICFICGEDLKKRTKTFICDDCKKKLNFIKNPCQKCGKDVKPYDSCKSCASHKYYFDKAISVVNYDEFTKQFIYNMKKNSERYLTRFMAYYMVCAYKNRNLKADCVVCVPAYKDTIKVRGFNQAKDLLNFCNDYLHLQDLSDCVVQTKSTAHQKDLSSSDRFQEVKDKYKILKPSKFKGKRVLIIDDVLTTGATTSKIAQLLKYCGAKKVFVLTFATVELKNETYENFYL